MARKAALESDTQSRILNVFRRIPWIHVERNNSGKLPDRYGRTVTYGLGKGSADLLCFIAPLGRCLALEVKRVGKRATKDQEAWLEAVATVGVMVGVVTSVEEACVYALAAYRSSRRLASGRTEEAETAERLRDVSAARDIEFAVANAAAVESKKTTRRRTKLKIAKAPASNTAALF